MPSASTSAASEGIRAVKRDLVICLQFYSRLPVRGAPWAMADLATALRLAPLAGVVVGLIGAAALLVSGALLGLPAWLTATMALTATVLATGALHEDGLADVADGFGGGATPERKLEIMRDSRIGTFGTLALILSVVARLGAITALVRLDGYPASGAALVAAAAASRGFGLVPLALLGPARASGLGQGVGKLPSRTVSIALLLASVASLLPMLFGIPSWRPILAGFCGLASAFGMAWLARRQIGGHTGDVAGAAQQLCEISYLLGLLVAPAGS